MWVFWSSYLLTRMYSCLPLGIFNITVVQELQHWCRYHILCPCYVSGILLGTQNRTRENGHCPPVFLFLRLQHLVFPSVTEAWTRHRGDMWEAIVTSGQEGQGALIIRNLKDLWRAVGNMQWHSIFWKPNYKVRRKRQGETKLQRQAGFRSEESLA